MNNEYQFFFNKSFYNNSKSKFFNNSFHVLELFETPSFCNARKQEVLSFSSIVPLLNVNSCLTPLAKNRLVVDGHVFGMIQQPTININEVL